MLKLIIQLSLLFLSLNLLSQNVDITIQDRPMTYGVCVTEVENGNLLMGTITGEFFGWGNFDPVLYKFNPEGNTLWSVNLESIVPYGDLKMISDIHYLQDSTYLVLASYEGCDYGGRSIVALLDQNGVVLNHISEIGYSAEQKLFIRPNGDIFMPGSISYIIAKDFSSIREFEVNNWNRFCVSFNENEYYMLQNDKITHLTFVGDEIEIVDWNFEGDHRLGVQYENSLVVLSDKTKLQKLDSSLNILDSITIEQPENYVDLQVLEDKLYMLGNDLDSNCVLKIMDTNLSPIQTQKLGGKHLLPTKMQITNDNILVTGTSLDGITNNRLVYSTISLPFSTNNGSAWLFKSNLEQIDTSQRIDLSIVDIETEQFEIINEYSCYFNYEMSADVSVENVKLYLKNNSQDTITHFNVNALFELCPGICASWTSLFIPLDNMSIAPGVTEEYIIDAIDIRNIPIEDDMIELCIWVSEVNGRTDSDQPNNRICETLDISTNTQDLTLEQAHNISPNPFSDQLIISLEHSHFEKTSFNVIDIYGRTIHKDEFESEYLINTEDWNSGVYFIQICNAPTDCQVYETIKH